MATLRLFVALWPDEACCEELRELHRKDQPGVRYVTDDQWHVTLRFLGEADVDTARTALGDVRAEPVEVRLGPMVDLLGDHSVIVHASGADRLAGEVARATRGIGNAPARRRFVGHLTLARLSGRARRAGRPPVLVGTPIAATFRASSFDLVASRLRPDGARYETIERYPLSGTRPAG